MGVEKRTFKPQKGALPKWLADIADEAVKKIQNMPEEERRLWDKIVALKEENRRLVAENARLEKRTQELTVDLAVQAPYAETFRSLFLSLSERDNKRLARLAKTTPKGANFFEAVASDLVTAAVERTKDHTQKQAGASKTNGFRNLSGDDLAKELAIRIRREHPDYSARLLAGEVAKRDRVTIGAEAVRKKIPGWVKAGAFPGWERRSKPGPKPKRRGRLGTR